MKQQAPSSKLQRSSKFQVPNLARGGTHRTLARFGVGAWCYSGAWSLVLGVSLTMLGGGLSSRILADEAPAWQLLPAVQVDGSGIYLHQLVGPQVSAIPQQVRLAPAPVVGQMASFSRAQIDEILQRVAPELFTTNWSGASQVRVTRRVRPLGETELRELLTATLQNQFVKDKGELELRFRSPWTAVNVPDEAFTVKVVDFPATGVSSSFIIHFELLTAQEKTGEWQVVAQGKLMRDVLVARAALKRGQLLNASDVTTERRDVVALREPLAISTLTDDALLELTENVAEGQPLLGRSVRQRPIVQRGRVVDALIQDGALSISMKVEVLGDGLLGQTVRVRNPRTKKEFLGKVQNEQTVQVTL